MHWIMLVTTIHKKAVHFQRNSVHWAFYTDVMKHLYIIW